MSGFTLPPLQEEDISRLEEHMRSYVCADSMELYSMMAFQMGWVDQAKNEAQVPPPPRLHGQLALSAARLLQAPDATALWTATAVELLHNFLLIHTDVHEANTERAASPSLWWQWGPSQAINTGDGMHAMARLALFKNQEGGHAALAAALHLFDSSALRICEGAYMDIDLQERLDVSEQDCLEIADRIDGSLAACALALPALQPDGESAASRALHQFGRSIGIARRIARDAAGLWGGAESADRRGALITKRKSLPVAHAFATAPLSAKRRLGELYMQRVIRPEALAEVADIAEQAGSRQHCRQLIQQQLDSAAAQLGSAGIGKQAASGIVEAGSVFAAQEEN